MMKKFMATLTAVAMLISLAACSPGDDSSSASSPSSTTTEASSGASTAAQLPTKDRAGNDIIVPEKVNTVVSLAPSVTQLLSDLGVADKIVGIDTQSPMYSNQLKEGLPQFDMMNIDAEALIALKPDIVFVSGISYVGGTDPLKSVRDAGICVVDIPSSTSLEGVQDVYKRQTTSGFGNPRRMATGFDYNRMNLLLAVLEKRAGFYFSNLDTYVNVVGGLRLDEPAVDLAVAMALISSLKDVPIKEDALVFGEIGLAGELRMTSHVQARISEAQRLGFRRCILPANCLKKRPVSDCEIELIGVNTVREAFEALAES